MLLLENKIPDPSYMPFAPMEIWTGGILESTVLSWRWNNGNSIFTRGWHSLEIFNFDHPKMKALIEKTHKEQEECLKNRPLRYPYWS